MGCGKKGHYLDWPTTLASLDGFSDTQREHIVAAITQLNLKINRTVVIPEGLKTQSSSGEGSPIFIKFSQNIPEQTNVIAGRATVESGKCTVQISSVVADDVDLLVPVIWHELGHCSGLDHDPKEGEIMYKTTHGMKAYDDATIQRFFAHMLEASGLNAAK